MNREIKFRIWDKNDNKMYYFPNPKWKAIYFDGLPWSFLNQVPLEFAGLKDKTSKEIYEGDIIRFQTEDDPEDLQWEIISVEFKHGSFWVEGNFKQPLWELLVDGRVDGEIIGNIFENPELLKT